MFPVISVGCDIGHSGTKVLWRKITPDGKVQSGRFFFPTAVIPAIDLPDEKERARCAVDLVDVGGRKFLIGESAVVHGDSPSFLEDDWIEKPEYSALLRGAVQKVDAEVRPPNGLVDRMLVLGLPGRLESLQRKALGEIAVRLCPGWTVFVTSQPRAPVHAFLQADDGNIAAGHDVRESWGVIDVGRYTTDAGASIDGRWSAAAVSSDVGTRAAENHLIKLLGGRGIEVSQDEAEMAIRTGGLKRFGADLAIGAERKAAVEFLNAKVLDYSARVFEPLRSKLNGIILAGGGAHLVEHALRLRWPVVHTPSEPRFVIADGMSKFGLLSYSALRSQGGRERAVAA